MFRITQGKGFQVKFGNGYTVSVQFGYGNYSENNSRHVQDENRESATAEVAAWDAQGKWLRLGTNDDVTGWQTPDQVLAIMAMVAAKE